MLSCTPTSPEEACSFEEGDWWTRFGIDHTEIE